MKFIDFIPSETVKNHLKNIGYELTPTDATCIVYGSHKTLNDKLQAYQTIIDTMPDCTIDDNGKTLHATLSKFITYNKQLIEEFYDNNNAWYCVDYCRFAEEKLDAQALDRSFELSENRYLSVEECVRSIKSQSEKYSLQLETAIIQKCIDGYQSLIFADYNEHLEMINITPNYKNSDLKSDYYDNTRLPIAHLELGDEFYTAFHTGDLIYHHSPLDNGEICVVNIRTVGDKQVYGYYHIHRYSSTLTYCNMEYFPGVLSAEIADKSQLAEDNYMPKCLSAFLKNEIDLGVFLEVYRNNFIEILKDDRPCNDYSLSDYAKQQLEQVGIIIK